MKFLIVELSPYEYYPSSHKANFECHVAAELSPQSRWVLFLANSIEKKGKDGSFGHQNHDLSILVLPFHVHFGIGRIQIYSHI